MIYRENLNRKVRYEILIVKFIIFSEQIKKILIQPFAIKTN